MSESLEVDQRVATAREFVARVFSGHDPERARDFFTADVVLHAGALGTTPISLAWASRPANDSDQESEARS